MPQKNWENPLAWIGQLRAYILRQPILTKHVRERMQSRNISLAEILKAIENGWSLVERDTVLFTDVTDPFHGVVVVVSNQGPIVTAYRRGSRS
ncbi:MAG: DUF4258 domain-containing protein [Planctomycetota bacterium]|nr:DUF4258 domain-containing protein [Planctomycetota bacterium]